MKYLIYLLLLTLLLLSSCSSSVPIDEDSLNVTSAFVTFTFDDATLDQFEVGYPILDKYDYDATLFVITGLVNQTFENKSVMSWNHIRALASDSWDIQSHTYSHPFLSRTSVENVSFELIKSKQDLEEQGFNVSILAFPYGDYNEEVFSLGKEHYSIVRGSSYGYNLNVSNPDYLDSKWTINSTTLEEMKSWLDDSIENNYWLIVMVHRVSYDSTDEYSVKPDVLEGFVDYVNEKRVPVKTLSEVLLR